MAHVHLDLPALGPGCGLGARTKAVVPSDTSSAPVAQGALLDDIQEWPTFSRPLVQPACWESNLLIEGMHCTACALNIEDAVRAVPGVLAVEVSGGSQRARVQWSADVTRPSRWLSAIERLGYRAVPANDVFARERRQQEARTALWRLGVAGLCMMQVMMYAYPAYVAAPGDLSDEMAQLLHWASWVLSLPVLLFSCAPFFAQTWRDVRRGQISMDLPAALGMTITFAVSSAATFEPGGRFGHEVYFDSFTMFVFFLLAGRWLELRLRGQTAGALEVLMNRLPESALRIRADGGAERVAVRRLAVGDVLRVLPGEAFVADACITQGHTTVDEALLSGESRPLARAMGEVVLAGSHNLGNSVQVRVTGLGTDTRFAQIVALMAQAAASKPALARLADRVARPFLWAVLLCAAAVAAWGWSDDPSQALMRAVAVLVVTCPCALALATPAALLAAAGQLARRGVLLKRLDALEALAGVDTVVFDKTGTLTQGELAWRSTLVREGMDATQALALAAALAQHSLHPLSKALVAAQGTTSPWRVQATHETPGAGVSARVCQEGEQQQDVRLGSASFCGLTRPGSDLSRVYLSDTQGWLASFDFTEQVRPDAQACVSALQQAGVAVRLLSGDSPAAVANIAHQLGITQFQGGCTPADKLSELRQLQAQGRCVVMVGDGLNDGPALALAQVSFAVGQAVPLTQAQADVVVQADSLLPVVSVLHLAQRSLRVVRQNLAWAAAYNAVCVPLALAGWLPAWLAGLGMALSSLAVVGNASRLARPHTVQASR